jgi:AcrR family transcriptional regulator
VSAETGGERGDQRVSTAVDKRRVILDAAVRVFARQGFHTCRVSDIADEAGVAYGLVYHYFPSKETILDTLFLERWDVMLATIAEAESSDLPPREKLRRIASFIVDSYSHDPDVMKVIVVEVTRAANTFGRTHVERIMQAYRGIARIVRRAQDDGIFRQDVDALFAAQAFYGLIEQVLTQWIFTGLRVSDDEFERVKAEIIEMICGGLDG